MTSVSAAEPSFTENITLSPVSGKFQLNAGDLTSSEVTVVNDGQTQYDFILYARPYSVKDGTYEPEYNSTSPMADAYKWVQLDQVRFHLNPGASVKVPFSIKVPQMATPGGHYGVLFAETQPSADQSGNAISRKKRVGMVLYITVKGEYEMKGETTDISIPGIQFRSPLSAVAKLKNDGNADFPVTTTFEIKDVLGNVKYSNTSEITMLPQTTRNVSLEWRDSPWFGIYNVSATTKLLEKQVKTVSKYVLVVPRWLLVVLGAIVVGGIGYAILRHKKRT